MAILKHKTARSRCACCLELLYTCSVQGQFPASFFIDLMSFESKGPSQESVSLALIQKFSKLSLVYPLRNTALIHGWRQIVSSNPNQMSGKDAIDHKKNQMGKVNNFPQNVLVEEIQISNNGIEWLQFYKGELPPLL